MYEKEAAEIEPEVVAIEKDANNNEVVDLDKTLDDLALDGDVEEETNDVIEHYETQRMYAPGDSVIDDYKELTASQINSIAGL